MYFFARAIERAIEARHTGTLNGSATWATGKSGTALSLNGNTDYVSLPANTVSDLTDFTFEPKLFERLGPASSCGVKPNMFF